MFRAATYKTVPIARKGNDSVSRRKEEEGGGRNRGNIQKGSSLQLVKCKNQKPTVTLRSMMARSRRCCTMAPLAGKTIEVNENAEADEFHARSVPDAILLARHTSYKHRDESRARFLRAFHTARAVCKLSLPESLPGQYCIFGSRPPATS